MGGWPRRLLGPTAPSVQNAEDLEPRQRMTMKSVIAVVVAAVLLAILAVGLFVLDPLNIRGPAAGGAELDLTADGWYEYATSRDVGEVFSTATPIHVTTEAASPIRLVEVRPVNHQGDAVTYLGTIVRLSIHPSNDDPAGLFTTSSGYPPSGHQVHRFVTPSDLEIQPPEAGQEVAFHVIMGYVATREGTMSRDGVEVVYEYEGRLHKVFEPNRIFVCVPAECIRPDRG
jgi:hypothetical protein